MNLSAARGRHAQRLLDLGGRLALAQRLGDRDGVPQAADHVVDQPRDALALLAQLEQQLDRGLLVAGDERVGERPDLLLGRGGAGLDDLLGADRRARAVLERELLELAQQPLLAVADLRDERLGALAVEVDLQRPGLAFQPLREIPRLDVVLRRDLAADLLDRLVELVRGLVAALLAGEERDRERLGVGDCSALMTGSTSESFQRSTPSAITNRRPIANVIVLSAIATPRACTGRPRRPRRRRVPASSSAIARRRARRSAMRPWSSPWMR